VDETTKRAHDEKVPNLRGFKDLKEFVHSIAKPRPIIILITAGPAVDMTIDKLKTVLEPGDIIIDGGNEWFLNTERRQKDALESKLLYMGMGVSGGEEGARHGPSLMPGGAREAYDRVEPILKKVAAQVVPDGACVTYIGPGGSGNYVKMVHNGIEYGDMQLIAESYDLLHNVGRLSCPELAETFEAWNKAELQSFLIEITAQIFHKKEPDGKSFTVDHIKDKTGFKGTGSMTVKEAVEQFVASPVIAAALDARFISGLLEERIAASRILVGPTSSSSSGSTVDKPALVRDMADALYCAKICSYAQGLNIIRAAAKKYSWPLHMGEIARIWKGGCIIRAIFLDRIKNAYARNPDLPNLLVDPDFSREINAKQGALRRIVILGLQSGVTLPAFSAALAYFDSYRRPRLPANLTQAQRDFFGAHTYERLDKAGVFHTEWAKP